MEERHVAITNLRQRSLPMLASTLRALRRLPATDTWLWLAGAGSCEPAAPVGLVLLHHLSGLLLATGTEIVGHG